MPEQLFRLQIQRLAKFFAIYVFITGFVALTMTALSS